MAYRTNQILRDTMSSRRISQTELSLLTGIPQGRISDYSGDRYELSLPTLNRLIAPLGFSAEIALRYDPTARRDVRHRWLLHYAIIEKLRSDPPTGWREHALDRIARTRESVHGSLPTMWLDRWTELVNGSLDELSTLSLRQDDLGEELRSVSPLVDILTQDERAEVLRDAEAGLAS